VPTPKIGVIIHTKLCERLFSGDDRQRLEELAEVVWTTSPTPITNAQAVEILRDCTIAVGSWQTPKPCEEILAACPNLELWEHVAGTVKSFFGPHLQGRNLTIASCKIAIADCVAEMTIAEIILGLRRVWENAAANRVGKASQPKKLKVMYGSKIGVIGASQVGRRVVDLAVSFGANVMLYDPFVAESEDVNVTLTQDLMELCESCDVVTLHTPLLESTKKLLGPDHFKAMRDDCVFINTSRGGCVDEAALIAELQTGRLMAFLDVTEPEPAADNSPLRTLPNVVLTSHIAGPQSFNLGAQAVDDIEAFCSGENPACIVTSDQLDRIA
jgi:phosphoglycerate dehydrogenase-like enzyme